MAESLKVVANPVNLTKDEVIVIDNSLVNYSQVLARRINNERNSEIKKILENEMDFVERTRSNLKR